jgi:MipA family protein
MHQRRLGKFASASILVVAGVAAALSPAFAQSLFQIPADLHVGGIVIVTPTYEGSKRYEVLGAPLIVPGSSTTDGIVQFKGLDDVRFRVLKLDGLEAGPLVGYRFGRQESDDRHLRGLGDVDGGLVVGAYAGYRFGALFPFVSYHHQVTGSDTGGIARFGVEGTTTLPGRIAVKATLGATWASAAYTESLFGVTTLQSARSGLRFYDTDAGIKDVFLAANADIPLDDRWTLKLLGRYSQLTGDAKDSPIVETRNQFFGGAGLTYRFSLK